MPSHVTGSAAGSRLEHLFTKSSYSQAPLKNYEGAPAFARSPKEAVVRALTTGTLSNTYYAKDTDLAEEAVTLFRQMAENDPAFLAKAIVAARQEGLMRLAPITALVVLSANPAPEAKVRFRQIFDRVIQTPGDLQDFLKLVRLKTFRGMGKTVTHAGQLWLARLSEYHAIKYRNERGELGLRDMYRLLRPTLPDVKANALARYVTRGVLNAEVLPQIAGYEAFKKAAEALRKDTSVGTGEVMALIAAHRLPWEVVTGQVSGHPEVWKAMIRQMPILALVRNLANARKYGVTNDPEMLDYICGVLTNPERIRTSKLFPFQFYSAAKALGLSSTPADTRLQEALHRAVDLSFENMPTLGKNVLVANDISASMTSKVSDKSEMSVAELAALFAAAIYKKVEHGEIVSFDDVAHPRHQINHSMSVLSIAQAVQAYGGGTNLSAPLLYALQRTGPPLDVFVGITDDQSWADHFRWNRGILDLIREYRAHVNPNLLVFLLQVLPYSQSQVPDTEPGVYYLYGWNASLLSYLSAIAGGGKSQVETIEAMTI